jgi:hypothetical protein
MKESEKGKWVWVAGYRCRFLPKAEFPTARKIRENKKRRRIMQLVQCSPSALPDDRKSERQLRVVGAPKLAV